MGRDVVRGRLVLPVDDDLAEMYAATQGRLAAAGFRQYEISNWAQPDRESRHNLTYWRDGGWIGVGAGAASSYRGRRWKNTPVLERYIQSVTSAGTADRVEDEVADRPTQVIDYLTLGLRLNEGVSVRGFKARFGDDLIDRLGGTGEWLLEQGLIELEGDGLRIPAAHQLITNEILLRLAEPFREPATGQVRRATSASQIAVR
jgi:oxygen-independent coproporphyrinogen-3 oxidase